MSGLRWSYFKLMLRRMSGAVRVATMTTGVGGGARFCSGPSNPEYAVGSNELPVQQALAQILRPGMTFFDVGANVGFFSVIAARLVGPAGSVVAFEPVADNAAYVAFNASLNDLRNVRVVVKAVSDTSGPGSLLLARYAGGAALEVAGAPPDFWKSRRVEVIRLDDGLEQGLLPVPNVLKVDVEGAEVQVLRGARSTLSRHRPVVVYEVDGPDHETVAARRQACDELLESLGYQIADLPDSYPKIRWVVRHAVATPRD